MKIRLLIASVGLFFILTEEAKAPVFRSSGKTIECQGSYHMADCPSCLNGLLTCNHRKTYIEHTTPLTHIKVIVTRDGTQKTYTLKKPPGQISDYSSIESNKWIQENIPGGLKYGDRIELAQDGGYVLGAETSRYENFKSKKPIGFLKDLLGEKEGLICSYKSSIHIVSADFCDKNICYAAVECYKDNQIMRLKATCKTRHTNQCPSAIECVLSEKDNINIKDIKLQSVGTTNVDLIRNSSPSPSGGSQ